MSEIDIPQVDATGAAPAKPSHPDLRWYVVHAYSGMEKSVERAIREGGKTVGSGVVAKIME